MYFDPYGGKKDLGPVRRVMEMTGLPQQGAGFYVNNHQFEKYAQPDEPINTCGYWCLDRMEMACDTNKQYRETRGTESESQGFRYGFERIG